MIEPIGKRIHFKNAAPVEPIQPVPPPPGGLIQTTGLNFADNLAVSTNPLQRVPHGGDQFVNSRTMYEGVEKERRQIGAQASQVAAAAFRGLTTTSAVVQSVERGNKAVSQTLDIVA